MKRLSVNAVPCTGCLSCESVCAQARAGSQDRRASVIRVELDLFGGLHRHAWCRQCDRPACVAACPSGALTASGAEGAVVPDPARCTRCGACVPACPFGAMGLSAAGAPVKCDLCGGEPLCVEACAFGALRFLDVSDPDFGFRGMPEAEQDPDLGRGTRVEEGP